MNNKTSPEELAGVKKKSFAMAYSGGEIWFEHLDGMYDFEELVLQKLRNDFLTFKKPSMPSTVSFNLDETDVSDAITAAITDIILNGGKRFTRIAFTGLDRKKQKAFKKALSGKGGFALAFINDLEKAKMWLVSESGE